MYRGILAPVDGTAFGECALRFAATLARRSGAVLHLVHVHESVTTPASMETLAYRGAWNEIVREQEAGYLEGVAERLRRSHDVRVEASILEGEVATTLAACVRARGASLVVMATHGRTGPGRLLHHRVSERLARIVGVPFLVVRPHPTDEEPELAAEPELRRVLIPLRGTSGAGSVLDHAVELGRLFRMSFTLLQVVQPESAPGERSTRNPCEHLDPSMRARTAARQYLNAAAERLRAGGLEAEPLVRFAPDVTAAIVSLIASRPPDRLFDLIMMESRPRRPLARLFTGSSLEMVARRARLPVLMVQ